MDKKIRSFRKQSLTSVFTMESILTQVRQEVTHFYISIPWRISRMFEALVLVIHSSLTLTSHTFTVSHILTIVFQTIFLKLNIYTLYV